MKISTTAPHPYNIYYIHTSQKWKLSFLGGKPGHEVEERSPLWWSVARIWWCWLPSETLSPASSSPRLKAWRDVRPAAGSAHRPSCNTGEREGSEMWRSQRQLLHPTQVRNDGGQQSKIENIIFLVVFIGKPGLVLTHVTRLANEYHQEINNEFCVPKQVSMENGVSFCFIYYLIIYEKYLVLYILQVLSHHNYWLCRCSKLLAQYADKTYANCEKFCSSSTFYLPWDSNFQLIIIFTQLTLQV